MNYIHVILWCLCVFASINVHAQDVVPGPDAPVAKETTEVPASAIENVDNVSKNSNMIDSLELRDMDINDVLKLIATKTGLNIIAGKDVTGRVSLFVQNIDVHDALSIILDANGLAYHEGRGVIKIMSAAEFEQTFGYKFGQKTESKIIALKAMKASDAVALLNQVKGPLGKVVADEASGTLFLEDVPGRLNDMLDYLSKADIPVKSEVFKIQYIPAEGLNTKLQIMLTPKVGSSSYDANTNKLFVKDTPLKLEDVRAYIKQIDMPMTTEVFTISNAKAEDLSKSVVTMLTKDIGHVEFDARSNSLIVTDIPPRMSEIRKIIKSLDKHEKEVLIEARIVQIGLTNDQAMGVDWEGLVQSFKHTAQIASNLSIAGVPLNTASIGTLDPDGYKLAIQAINTMNKSKTLSNPRIAVLNNQEAHILVGSNKAYVTSSTTTPASGAPVTANAVNFIELGIKLTVTPTIHPDGYITIKIKPEVSGSDTDVDVKDENGNINKIPIKNTSELETVVSVKDGITIVMGGLIKDETSNSQKRVPVLGSIPVLGHAFRNENKVSERTEIVIFLTPHIISGDINEQDVQETISNYPVVSP